MTKLNLKKGDTVVVISGKEKGKTGKITEVSQEQKRAIVDGVNVVTKHQKPRSQKDKGGLIKKSAPIDASNLMIICSACGKATRVAHKELDGKNARICKKCGASLDKAFVKSAKKEAKKKDEVAVKEEKQVKEEKVVKTEVKKTTTAKKPATKSVETKVKKESAKVGTTTARRSTNRGK